jgi:Tol biopolymer transport system component
VPATAGVAREVAIGDKNVHHAGWAPDANTLYFFDARAPEEAALHFLDLKTMKQTTVPDSKGRVGAQPSPDGRYLAATTVDGPKLLLFDLATQNWSDLATASVNAIQWSGDSKFIYFDNQSAAEPAIYRVRISDRKLETVDRPEESSSCRSAVSGTGWDSLLMDLRF